MTLRAPAGANTPRARAAAALLVLVLVVAAACGDDGARDAGTDPAPRPPAPAATVEVREAVPYVTAADDGRGLVLDAYLPRPAGEPRPAVVLVHGGAWRGGGRADMLIDAQILAQQGYVAFAIDYRRTVETVFPEQVEDVAEAVAFVRENAGEFNVDPQRVAVFGASAGGNLAALAGTSGEAHEIAGGPPSAVVSWSGPMDLRAMARNDRPRPGCTPGAPEEGGTCALPEQIVEQMPAWIGCPLDESARWLPPGPRPEPCPDIYDDGSPVRRVTPGDAPMLLVHGASDPLVGSDQARTMAAALRDAGVDHATVIVPGEGHGVQLRGEALAPTLAFLAAH